MPLQSNGVKKETKKNVKKKQSKNEDVNESIMLLLNKIDDLESRLFKVEGRMGL